MYPEYRIKKKKVESVCEKYVKVKYSRIVH